MSYSFQHSGGALPITLALDEVSVTRPCPTCARIDREGTLTITAPVDRPSGSTPATCTAGHLVMVQWSRATGDGSEG